MECHEGYPNVAERWTMVTDYCEMFKNTIRLEPWKCRKSRMKPDFANEHIKTSGFVLGHVKPAHLYIHIYIYTCMHVYVYLNIEK